jgi:hypothetical protein
MKLFNLLTLIIISIKLSAQLPSIYLKTKLIKQFASETKVGNLYVVIDNEKNDDDAALIDAIKTYWKHGAVTYLSSIEFNERIKSKKFDAANFYLFPNFKSLTRSPYAMYRGFYLTNKPYELLYAAKPKRYPFYLFFSSYNMSDSKSEVIKGYYALMIKNFNYDINFCRSEDNFKTKPKYKRVKGLAFIKETNAFDKKTFLLVKEQVRKKEKNAKKDKKEKKGEQQKSEIENTTLELNKIVLGKEMSMLVVFPEDIDYAVKKNDKDILLFNGSTIYSAQDGSVYATYIDKPSSSFIYYAYSLVSVFVSVAVFTFVLAQ